MPPRSHPTVVSLQTSDSTAAWLTLCVANPGLHPQVAAAKVRARAAVLNLVAGRAAPPHLWVPLLFAAIPVIEASPPAFSTADTEQLLLAMQACLARIICQRTCLCTHPEHCQRPRTACLLFNDSSC